MNRKQAVEYLQNAYKILSDDIDAIQDLYTNKPVDALARALARTYSAYIEGVLYQLRQITISSAIDAPELFTREEWNVLEEKDCYLNKKGEIETKDSFQKFLPMMLFTFKQYVKIHGATFTPDTSDNRWGDMKNFVGFRNRLMHPKQPSDLQFSQNDLDSMMEAVSWFHDTSGAMFSACKEADKIHNNALVCDAGEKPPAPHS